MRLHILGVSLVLALVAFDAAAQRGETAIQLDTLANASAVTPGGELRIAFKAELPEGYHVNSDKPLDDFLIPTAVTFELPAGVTLRETVFPEPTMLEQEGSENPLAVFGHEFVIGVALGVDTTVAPGEFPVNATLRYQACDETQCYRPMNKETPFALKVVKQGDPIESLNAEIFKAIPFTGEATAPTEAEETPATTPTPQPAHTEDAATLLAALGDFEVLSTEGYLKTGDFLAWIDATERGEVRKGWFEDKGPLAIIALVLLGGLALNLTPCVLPMIPINLAIIGAGAQAGSRTRGALLGGTYGLAMAAVYGVLGLVVILTAGTFGTINSSPWFNLGIAALFVVLALGMFDIINIDFSKYQAKLNMGGKSKGSFILAFAMGAVAALLAGACVAPVVIQVIVFSSDLYAKGNTIALALPFLLGIGMALPWPIAGAGLSFLPKPGKWMLRVKQAFGVFILAFAAYYAYLAYEILDQRNVDPDAVARSAEEKIEAGWYPSLAQGLQVAKAENKMVLVDLWATWCKNCMTMDATTLKDSEVTARLEDYVKIKFQAEDPAASPAKEVMAHFNAIGLPTYAILRLK